MVSESKKNNKISIVFIILINTTERRTHPPEKMRGGTRLTATTRTLQTRRRMQSVATATTRTAGSMRSSSHLLRKFLPSSLVLVLPDARNSFENSSRKRTHFFSTNAAGRNNKEQGRGKGEGGQRRAAAAGGGGRRRRRTRDDSDDDDAGGWGAGLRHARQGGRGGEGRERIQQQQFLQGGGGRAVPPPAPPGWKPGIREDMKNDFDAIRAATTEPPREGMMRTTKKTSSSAPKNTATNRFKRNRGKGGDEERKREFQRQMDQFKRMEEKEDEKGNYNAPRQRRGDDAYQDEETVFNRAPVPKGMSRFFVTCHPGLEKVVAKELSSEEIRARNVEIGASGVSFVGNLETAYNANIWLRSGTRVLCELASGDLDPHESGFDSVYDFVKHCVPWHEVLTNANLTFSIEARVWSNSQISSTKLACTRAKDAICDYISDACDGIRPRDPRDFRGNKIKADVPLFMTLYKDRATLYRDTSGDSLHRRGYRANLSVHRAALNEAAAAGLLYIAGWPEALEEWRSRRDNDDIPPPVFIDPMCGSGTMVVEAALMAMNVAPGLVRYKNGGYAFQNWPDFNEDVFLDCIDNAERKRIEEEEFHQLSEQKNKAACLGNDIHPGSVSLAQRSALAAGVPHVVKVYQSSVDEWVVPPSLLESKRRTICTNPPWGKRISLDSRMSDANNIGQSKRNYDDEYDDNDDDVEERWRGGDGAGDDYDEILPGDVNSTEAGDAWRKLGIFLKREMPNQSAFVLSGDPSVSREIYMRANRKHVLGIGGVDTRLLRYDILPPKPKDVL